MDPQTEGLSDEEQADRMEMFGQLFRSIYFDDSEAAERVIGVIDGKNITAKELELRALKMREGGEACPYKAAWEAMCQEAAELRYIKAQNRYDDFSDISRQAFLDMKDAYAEDEVFRRYCDEQKNCLAYPIKNTGPLWRRQTRGYNSTCWRSRISKSVMIRRSILNQ